MSQPSASRPVRSILVAALALAAVSAGISSATPATAQSANSVLCSQPVEPTCVSSELTYEDEQRINRCRQDMERYASQVEEYVDCLKRKSKHQIEVLEDLRHQLECRANDEVSC